MKHFNINTNVNNNNTNVSNNNSNVNNDNTNDDYTYDGKIRDKISDIRVTLSRLGNIVTKNDRDEIKKELYGIEKKRNLSYEEKEKIYDNLPELVNKLNKKVKYRYNNRDDLDYHGIRDVENLVDNIDNGDDDNDDDDDCKPILVENSFKENYKYYESRGNKDKKLSVEQYLDMIKPYLSNLINENRAIETSSNEWKIQINMHVNFVSSKDTGEIRTIFVWSENKYQNWEIILRNGSNFVFESVSLLSYLIHKRSLRRGNWYIKSPEWIANKKATINPKDEDNRCFEYSIVVALHHKEIENHPERISPIHYYFS